MKTPNLFLSADCTLDMNLFLSADCTLDMNLFLSTDCMLDMNLFLSSDCMLRPFLIGNEHERSHEHSKHRCFLIDLASTSWCLDFARTVFMAVFGSESRHLKRSRIWQDGGTQIQATRRKHADNGSGSIYVWEEGKRNKQGERKNHWFWLHVRWDTPKIPKRGAENTEIYLGTQLENCRCTHTRTHTHARTNTHFITHDRF